MLENGQAILRSSHHKTLKYVWVFFNIIHERVKHITVLKYQNTINVNHLTTTNLKALYFYFIIY